MFCLNPTLAVMRSCFSNVRIFVTCQAPLSVGFSRQENWSGLLCSAPGDLLHQELNPMSLVSIALAGRQSTTSATWEALLWQSVCSQFILTSPVAQTVKNLPAMQETQVCIPGMAKSQTRLSDFHFHLYF